MAAFLSDDFNALGSGNGLSTDASWLKFGGGLGDFAGSNASRLRPVLSGSSAAVSYENIDASPPSADYEVRADVIALGTVTAGPPIGILGRVDSAANSYYYARAVASSGNWQLYSVTGGTATQLGSSVAHTFVAGTPYRLVLRMVGTAIDLIVDGVTKISATDSAVTAAGRPGVRHSGASFGSNANGIHLDNFEAEAVGGGATGKPWYLYQRMRRAG